MKYKIYYSPESQQDMDEIWDYIEKEYYDPELARETIYEIIEAIDALKRFPEIGAPLSRTIPIAKDHRFIVSGNYNVFYRLESSHIYIDRVLHKRRNYLHLLFDI